MATDNDVDFITPTAITALLFAVFVGLADENVPYPFTVYG